LGGRVPTRADPEAPAAPLLRSGLKPHKDMMIMRNDDIIGDEPPRDWLAVGWFTPDYRPLAEHFAVNLAEHSVPFHLFAREKLVKDWSTAWKPDCVLHALSLYRGKTVVLMDLDCIIHGDISPVVDVPGDVGICVIARNLPGRLDRRWRGGRDRQWRHQIAVECSSRVVVFKPTEGACAFALSWRERVVTSLFRHDEHSMVWAFLRSAGATSFSYLDARYSGREVGEMPGAVIEHESAHTKLKALERGSVRKLLKAIERPFRSGRTRAHRQQLQDGPVVLQAQSGRVQP
jgi:hypothetical protein